MSTRLESFRDHCARMATAEHKPECPMLTWREPYWCSWIPVYGGRVTTYRTVWQEADEWWPRWRDHDGPDPRGEANLHVAQLAAQGIEATVHRIDGSDT